MKKLSRGYANDSLTSTDLLIPVDQYLNSASKELDEYLWNFEEQSRIDLLQERIDYAREIMAKGDVYVPMF